MTNYTPTPLDEFLAESVREAEAAKAKERDDDEQSGAVDEDDIVVEGQVTG